MTTVDATVHRRSAARSGPGTPASSPTSSSIAGRGAPQHPAGAGVRAARDRDPAVLLRRELGRALEASPRARAPGFDYKAFIVPACIIFGVTGISRAGVLVTDIQDGYFDRLLLTPMRRLGAAARDDGRRHRARERARAAGDRASACWRA